MKKINWGRMSLPTPNNIAILRNLCMKCGSVLVTGSAIMLAYLKTEHGDIPVSAFYYKLVIGIGIYGMLLTSVVVPFLQAFYEEMPDNSNSVNSSKK